MKGYRTIIVMLLGMLFSLMAANGWVVPESDQAAIQSGILSIVGLILRVMTTGPVGSK